MFAILAVRDVIDRLATNVGRLAEGLEQLSRNGIHLQNTQDVQTDILLEIYGKLMLMSDRENASWEKYQANVQALKDGYLAVTAENTALREEIGNLTTTQQEKITAAVDKRLEADAEHDADRIDAADAALDQITQRPDFPRPADATPQTTESGVTDPDPTSLPGDPGYVDPNVDNSPKTQDPAPEGPTDNPEYSSESAAGADPNAGSYPDPNAPTQSPN